MGNENKNLEAKRIYPFEECELYIDLLQRNIDRMGKNSANCKTWILGIIGAAFSIAIAKDKVSDIHNLAGILYVTTSLLFFLDCYYLGLERRFKDAEKLFHRACIHGKEEDAKILFMSFSDSLNIEDKTPDFCTEQLRKMRHQLIDTIKGAFSISTTPFYAAIYVTLALLV